MGQVIEQIEKNSLAQELGLLPGDEIQRINGETLIDLIDLEYLCSSSSLCVEFKRGGEIHEVSCEKDEWEPLGVSFKNSLLQTRSCANNCIFCFVDQMPAGCRESLYIKDDDWRMSLMMGNFVTLTNIPTLELERIIKRKASPIYVSVHATDPALRRLLLGNERAPDIMEQLTKLKDAGIQYHLQAVLCPGFNDGAQLDKTIEDLASLMPSALSFAVVPVGLTGHREGLHPLRTFSKEEAAGLIDQVENWQKKFLKESGSCFVFIADELYCTAERDFPPPSSYEGYPQIENGVGLYGQLLEDFTYFYEEAQPPKQKRRLLIASGTAIAPRLQAMLRANPIKNVSAEVRGIDNVFFGKSVNVTGLLTATCLQKNLGSLRGVDELLLSSNMFKAGTHLFLDDQTAEDLQKKLSIPIRIVEDSGEGLIEGLTGKGGTLING